MHRPSSCANNFAEGDALHPVNLLTAFNPGEIKYVVDEPGQSFAFVDYGLKVFCASLLIQWSAHRQSFSEHSNRRQWGFELMRDARHKVRSHFSDLDFAADIAEQQKSRQKRDCEN